MTDREPISPETMEALIAMPSLDRLLCDLKSPPLAATPEMVAAGLAELAGFDWIENANEADDLLKRIWRAMFLAGQARP
jgi:hypothetical protein